MPSACNKNSLLRSCINPQDYYDSGLAFGLPPLGNRLYGSRRQNSLLQSSTNPRTFITPVQHLGYLPQDQVGWEPDTIKIVCCKAALTPGLLLPQYHLGHLPLALDGLGAGDNKIVCCEAALSPGLLLPPQQRLASIRIYVSCSPGGFIGKHTR